MTLTLEADIDVYHDVSRAVFGPARICISAIAGTS